MPDNSYKKAIWHTLVAGGGAIRCTDRYHTNMEECLNSNYQGHIDLYGGHVNLDPKATKKIMNKIGLVGIDYDKSTDPAMVYGSEFVGTFEDNKTVHSLEGKLVLKDGTEALWGVMLDEEFGFGDLVQRISVDEEVDLDFALKRLAFRLEQAEENDWTFSYYAKLSPKPQEIKLHIDWNT